MFVYIFDTVECLSKPLCVILLRITMHWLDNSFVLCVERVGWTGKESVMNWNHRYSIRIVLYEEKVFEFGLIFDVRLIVIVSGIDKYVTSIQFKSLTHSIVRFVQTMDNEVKNRSEITLWDFWLQLDCGSEKRNEKQILKRIIIYIFLRI